MPHQRLPDGRTFQVNCRSNHEHRASKNRRAFQRKQKVVLLIARTRTKNHCHGWDIIVVLLRRRIHASTRNVFLSTWRLPGTSCYLRNLRSTRIGSTKKSVRVASTSMEATGRRSLVFTTLIHERGHSRNGQVTPKPFFSGRKATTGQGQA